MQCLHPLAFYARLGFAGYIDSSLIPFKPYVGCSFRGEKLTNVHDYFPVNVACGSCVSCQCNRKLQLSLLMEMELATTKAPSSFITLTYNDKHLPDFGYNVLHIQRFLKSFKQWLRRNAPQYANFKYLWSAEYGSKSYRPHFHIVTFGLDPYMFNSLSYDYLYRSGSTPSCEFVDSLWKKGFNYTLPCNKVSCRYVAGYTEKKLICCTDTYLQHVKKATYHRKRDTPLPTLVTVSPERMITPDQREFVKTYNKHVKKFYAFTRSHSDNSLEYCPDFVHGRCLKLKGSQYFPAEKVCRSTGFGKDYFNLYYRDFLKGYISAPDGSGVKYKIPSSFLEKLKDMFPDFYTEYRVKRANYCHDSKFSEDLEKVLKQRNIDFNPLSTRILDFEPLDSIITREFEEFA